MAIGIPIGAGGGGGGSVSVPNPLKIRLESGDRRGSFSTSIRIGNYGDGRQITRVVVSDFTVDANASFQITENYSYASAHIITQCPQTVDLTDTPTNYTIGIAVYDNVGSGINVGQPCFTIYWKEA